MQPHRRLASRALLLGLLSGCGASASAPPAAPTPQPSTGTSETANAALRGALASVLQGRGAPALAALRPLDPAQLSTRNAATRACMLERLGQRQLPPVQVADRFVAGVLTAYRRYWLRGLLNDRLGEAHERELLEELNGRVRRAGGREAATPGDLEPVLDSLIRRRGYNVLLGVTHPFRELMLWRSETEERYDVPLPEGIQPVTVVFMDDFASLGWAGFATCGRSYSGGWTRPDRLYAVRGAYQPGSESFRVSYLVHEGQHFADNRRFPELERQDALEYRAKLAELALARSTAYELLGAFAGNVSDDPGIPHSFANAKVVRGLAARLYADPAPIPVWSEVPVERINAAARELLREDTERLAAAQVAPTVSPDPSSPGSPRSRKAYRQARDGMESRR